MSEGTIAIVDDNIEVLTSLKHMMEAYGFKVKTYCSPASFLEDSVVRPACLIIDHNMPSMTGIQLVAQLRKEGNRVPVLLTSGFVEAGIVDDAASLGIECVLPKPMKLGDMLTFVRKYC
jgi:FixJ family two-component response regulator